jgi:hypothetical protein
MTDAIRALREAVEARPAGQVFDGFTDDLDRWFEAFPTKTYPVSDNARLARRACDGDMNAALALMKAVLPGWEWWADGVNGASVWYAGVEGDAPYFDGEYGPNVDTPARALLLAVLKALEATASASQSPAHLGNQEGDSQ